MIEVSIKKLMSWSWGLLMASIIFGWAEIVYFGSNWFPQTHTELMCDFISIGLFAASVTLKLIWMSALLKAIKNYNQ